MMTTAPYLAQAATAVHQSFGIRSTGYATSPAWEDPIELEIIEWDLEADEERIPHVRATITIATPDAATLALLDPRAEVYIHVDTGYLYADETLDLQPYIGLGLRRRTVTHVNTQLVVESEEAFIDDGAIPISRSGGSTFTGTDVEDLITDILTTYTDVELLPTINNTLGSVTLPSPYTMTYNRSRATDPVERAKSWAAAVGGVLWCDQFGVWQLAPAPAASDTVRATLRVDPKIGTIGAYRLTLSRDDGWGNRLAATYADNSDAWQLYPIGPTSPTDPTTWRDKVVNYELAEVPAGATLASSGRVIETDTALPPILDRLATRGERLELDTIVHLWLRVGHRIDVILDDDVTRPVLVSSFRASSRGTMTIRTRTPE